MDLFWVGIGLLFLGYFIGEGLKNFKNPGSSETLFGTGNKKLIKEEDLHSALGIPRAEMKEMLEKYPDIPKIELKNVNYYQYGKVIEWLEKIK
ncbi:DNA-binding protein [Bacillus toyonensis]|uniref:DNA-binding protein n=1 Tax=Bacillus toyonensis TaxID=155322 RepID=UPI002E1C2921|nr:DNA-binding protein [Bacillus toyonensis]